MRTKIMLTILGLILIGFNYSVYQNEQIKEQGVTLLLALAPLDPRSLMQGDYMELEYGIAETAQRHAMPPESKYIVIGQDENNVGAFIRFYTGEPLAKNEKLLRFYGDSRISIQPDSFLFQEGHAELYEDADYGVFKFTTADKYLLIGLADKNGKTILIP